MDQSDLLPRLKKKIVEASDTTELDTLRDDALTAYKHGDIMPSDVEDCIRMIHNQRIELHHMKRRADEIRQEITDCETLDGLTAIAKCIAQEHKEQKISGWHYRSLCDTGRTRREELTQGNAE